jgi:hypothetical protein
MIFPRISKINNPKKVQIISLKTTSLAWKITEILKVLDEKIAANRRNKNVFLGLEFLK